MIKNRLLSVFLFVSLLAVVGCLGYRFTSVEIIRMPDVNGISPFNLGNGITSFRYRTENLDSLGIRILMQKSDDKELLFEVLPYPNRIVAWNTLTPLIVFVKKNKGTNISKVVYTQSVPFLTNRRNLIRIPKTILNDAEICFGCFVIEDIYKNYNDNRHALVFFQKIFYEDEIQ